MFPRCGSLNAENYPQDLRRPGEVIKIHPGRLIAKLGLPHVVPVTVFIADWRCRIFLAWDLPLECPPVTQGTRWCAD